MSRRPARPTPKREACWVALALCALISLITTGCSTSGELGAAHSGSAPLVTVAGIQETAPPLITVIPTWFATTTTTPMPFHWLVIGDSYSAGIGASGLVDRSNPECGRDLDGAYASIAATQLRNAGRDVAVQFLACDGGTIGKVVDLQLPLAAKADLITVTMGGNDLGFSRIIAECLIEACRSYDQPDDTFPGFTPQVGRTDWETIEGRLMSAFAAMYTSLSPEGQIVALRYPLPFPTQPDSLCMSLSAPIDPTSQLLANAAIYRLNEAISYAAQTVNKSADRYFITVLDWQEPSSVPARSFVDEAGRTHLAGTNPNGICSPDPWVAGISSTELGDSFHPTDAGQVGAAHRILDWLANS